MSADIRERVARDWHATSDHAADGTPYGGPLCNCYQLAGRLVPLLAAAWDHGHSWGWADAQDAHAVPQSTDRAEWTLCTPNPYQGDTDE